MTPRRIDLLTLELEKRANVSGRKNKAVRDAHAAARAAAELVAIARAPLEAR